MQNMPGHGSFVPTEVLGKLKVEVKDYLTRIVAFIYESEAELCSFGIFTDSDISGFVVGYNTAHHLNAQNISNLANPGGVLEAVIKSSNKWWIPEWTSGSNRELRNEQYELYQEICDGLEEVHQKTQWHSDDGKNTFILYKDDIFDLLSESLKELKEEGIFNKTDEDFFLLVQEEDNGMYGERGPSLKKILNDRHYRKYLAFCK
ncbi:MAG: DUF4303 domain-containing protein [Cytophagales bacterium]|nr:DUF4303 domain-containing protein [Cytophagales bacterium]